MIYILAGMAKSGKSYVANHIFKQYHIKVVQTDWVMMMLYHGNKALNIDVSKSDVTVSHAIKPYLHGLIKALKDSKENILIEGVHIQPAFALELSAEFKDQIKTVFLGFKEIDPMVKAKQLKAHASYIDNPWYNHMDEDALYRLTRYLQDESQKLYDACITHQQTYIEVNDIKTDITHIIKTLFLD